MAINKVEYNGSTLIDLTEDTIKDNFLLDGVVAHDASGEKITGQMPNNGEIIGMIDGIIATSATIPSGYTSGGIINLSNDIENALAAI